jgi:hypothetical protein
MWLSCIIHGLNKISNMSCRRSATILHQLVGMASMPHTWTWRCLYWRGTPVCRPNFLSDTWKLGECYPKQIRKTAGFCFRCISLSTFPSRSPWHQKETETQTDKLKGSKRDCSTFASYIISSSYIQIIPNHAEIQLLATKEPKFRPTWARSCKRSPSACGHANRSDQGWFHWNALSKNGTILSTYNIYRIYVQQ